ncbi:tyrosine-protein phosphatase non-receptor type 4 isoform X3 [Neodiprion pinetum]|uniref:protein-tyrosine-phosphatase n=1 Tax=Neodiprion lecontei TaxID=441921 RepID=A0A6J0CE22_NEOLC|nr:tyrosine-protein phosphatase non-receptor type 4 isoform X3 [Neodiprion lecontei]XP_046424577.1 tyrosine-protein phosphatase non-receptor type 4 isoform X3 [Neodiprion fabricii]XP_046482272.1 tyrosine-protein phosphatase non-receptor type 4 isoform X3 [Neodiprion pinetum]XP_046623297.1 tyrosine-protein phosphatase non-receptor type 4 isoform X3 [Neodiprion virginianus]
MTSEECRWSGREVVPRRWLTRFRFSEMIESVSRRALSGSSGSYHVRGAELARDRRLKSLSATVVFLDDTQHTFQLDKRAKGQVLLDMVYQHLELIEKDYFGLQYTDNGATPSACPNPDIMRWLDPAKPVKKQIRSGQFFFRVKFYVSDPSKLQEEYTRYQFYLQIRRDILQGRLQLPPSTACLIASYTVQSELGDYHPEEHGPGYLSRLQLIPGQTEDMEKKIAELHKLHKGQLPADAEYNFLDHAKRLDMYGVELHKARDSTNKEIQLGVTSIGLVVFQNNIRINVFSWSKIVKISFKRKQFFIQLRREQSENYDTLLGFNMQTYRSSKNLWKACVEHHTFFRLHSPKMRSRRFPLTLSSRFTYSGRTEFQTVEDGKHRARVERTFIRSPSKRLVHGVTSVPIVEDKGKLSLQPGRPVRPYDNKVQSLGSREPRQAWGEGNPSDDEGGFLSLREEITGTHMQSGAFSPLLGSRVLSYADDDTAIERNIYDLPDYSEPTSSPAPQILEDGLVNIRLTPDEQGRFGFNVKGGLDLEMPILVSRVAPNTPADRCYPKLNEGDQVVCINGIDVNGMLHEHVVNLIRQSRDSGTGELTLTVRPNALYNALAGNDEASEEEPPYRYVPDVPHATVGLDALAQSMLLLADGLASGALIAQYEQLYRKNPELVALESKKPENQNKNRYRDISPYDVTRVILMGSINGDYINANYVNMEIPGSGIINRYIATQGPLSSTVADFWQMVLEAGSTLVVMLTTLVERGRAKCHQYWPAFNETLTLRNLTLTSTAENIEDTFVFREFILRDINTGEERDITHMQYCAWPDHGVPSDWRQFTTFTERVRAARTGMVEPAVVHCSAGIGRTGVLVLMETALCLMEANQPVYPLDIVRSMRDQRAMMIQNASQYRFVCEAVHKAYTEGIAKPLPEFSR